MGTSGTFFKAYVLDKEHPQLSPKIHGIWHHLLADWDQVLQEVLWNMEQGRTSNTMRCGAFFNEVRQRGAHALNCSVIECNVQ